MKKTIIMLSGAVCLSLSACDVDKTENGQMPDVDVNVSGGAELPEYNVTGPDVDVGMENKTVQVPTMDVDVPAENKQ